jgi:antitoxin PrlF
MAKSTITTKYQTTVPKKVREKLEVGPGDMLQWDVVGDHVRVTASNRAFLDLWGSFKVGPGDPIEDVRRARELMGTDKA